MNAPVCSKVTQVVASSAAPLLALGVVLLAGLPLAHAATPPGLLARVERVDAGDCFVAIAEDGARLRVRLLGVDAPTAPQGKLPGQPFGEAAQAHLTRLIGGRTVRLVPYGREGSAQTLAVVFVGPTNVNVEMVAQGLAEVDRGAMSPAYRRDLKVAERKARRDRVGMWGPVARRESAAAFRSQVGIQDD
jgi:micrococcal nuclease